MLPTATATASAPAPPPLPALEPLPEVPPVEVGPGTVLLVDDEPPVLRALQRTLKPDGMRVTLATSGAEALNLLAVTPFDVVISDMRMPGMDGAELLGRIGQVHPECTRILLTGFAQYDNAVRAVNEGGATYCLEKPWDETRLRQIVRDSVELRRLRTRERLLAEISALQNARLRENNDELERRVAERTEAIRHTNALLESTCHALRDSYHTMVQLLAGTVGLRDPGGQRALFSKSRLAEAMAAHLELPADAIDDIRHATLLHGLGLLALPDAIFAAPRHALSPADRRQYETHPLLAEAILSTVPQLAGAAALVRMQHEHYDGRGFPNHVVRDGIPLGARIVAIARDYHDLQAGHVEARRMSPSEAIAWIHAEAGRRYDPAVVRAFDTVLPTLVPETELDGEALVEPAELREGMVLSRDLLTPGGAALLPARQRLNAAMIRRLRALVDDHDMALDLYVRDPSH